MYVQSIISIPYIKNLWTILIGDRESLPSIDITCHKHTFICYHEPHFVINKTKHINLLQVPCLSSSFFLMHNYTSKLINATKWKRYSPLLKASEECSVGSIRIIHAGGALLPFLSWRITSGGPFTYHSKKFENIVCFLCTLSNVHLGCVVHAFWWILLR